MWLQPYSSYNVNLSLKLTIKLQLPWSICLHLQACFKRPIFGPEYFSDGSVLCEL